MDEPQSEQRVLLRAEMSTGDGRVIVGHTLEISEGTIFVVTEHMLALGTRVRVELSFPRLLDPLALDAYVVDQRIASMVGDASGLTLACAHDAESSRDAFVSMLDRLACFSNGSSPASATGCSLLLVEDSAFIRDMFSYGLEKFCRRTEGRVRLDHAERAAQAWAMLEQAGYDLLVVDYYLPDEDGASFIARVRQDERFEGVPIVATSVGGREAREPSIAAGADLFLDKPLVLRDLFGTLQRLAAAAPPPKSGHLWRGRTVCSGTDP